MRCISLQGSCKLVYVSSQLFSQLFTRGVLKKRKILDWRMKNSKIWSLSCYFFPTKCLISEYDVEISMRDLTTKFIQKLSSLCLFKKLKIFLKKKQYMYCVVTNKSYRRFWNIRIWYSGIRVRERMRMKFMRNIRRLRNCVQRKDFWFLK